MRQRQECLSIHIGSPVWGCDFFDREQIIQDCWRILDNSSIILSAPRRYGKSSVMLHLRDNPPAEFFPIYFELEDHFNINAFIIELISKIVENDQSVFKKFQKGLSRVFKDVDEIDLWKFKIKLKKAIETERDWDIWKERVNQLIIDLLENKKSKKLIFIFDEFPLMLYNFISEGEMGEHEAVKVLQWLRKLRHDSPFMENIRFIFGGSICIEKMVSYLKATRTINDVAKIIIGPFEHNVVEDFIKEIFRAKEIPVTDRVIKTIIEVVGTLIPIYLQIMIDSLIKESMNTGKEINPALVQYCYERRVHGPEYKRYFEDYYERLWRYYSQEDSKSAKRILKELANADNGVLYNSLFNIYQEEMGNIGNREKFDLLIAALENDFYIERNVAEGKIFFQNKWLKDWWRIYHGF